MSSALVLEDDVHLARALGRLLQRLDIEPIVCGSVADAKSEITRLDCAGPDLMLLDVGLPDGSGLSLLRNWPGKSPAPPTIVITGDESQSTAVECVHLQALDILTKPFTIEALQESIARHSQDITTDAGPSDLLDSGLTELQSQRAAAMVAGVSKITQQFRRRVEAAASTPFASVSIHGDAGVHKLLVAARVHELSGRAGRMITVNCSALTSRDAARELFGVHRDEPAAQDYSPGLIEQSAAGTLVLDDATMLPLHLQARLCGLLDTGHFSHVNGLTPRRARLGIVGILREDADLAIEQGRLLPDFLYRLSGYRITVPSLISRGYDVKDIVQALVDLDNRQSGANRRLDDASRAFLRRQAWPGNMRELETTVQQALQSGANDTPLQFDGATVGANADEVQRRIVERYVGDSIWVIQRDLLFATLEHHDQDKNKTAETLGISLKTLYNRLHAYT